MALFQNYATETNETLENFYIIYVECNDKKIIQIGHLYASQPMLIVCAKSRWRHALYPSIIDSTPEPTFVLATPNYDVALH